MAVAAAIGVGNDEAANRASQVPRANNGLSQRLNNKMKMMPNHPAALGEINRSIEKMSIGSYPTNQHCGLQPPSQTQTTTVQGQNVPVNRRGSNWTNSTEGYGSMRSEQSILSSRRCSDVSQMSQGSNISTRAMVGGGWDPMSADSSRRSSLQSNHGGVIQENHSTPNIGHHLDRLHRRAQQGMPTMPEPTGTHAHPNPSMVAQMQPVPGTHPGGVRRASDPVRTLDRNFGVDGSLSRHQRSGSYTQLNMGQQTRVPMHGQRIRGMSGDTFFHHQPNQQMQQVTTL
jgi:hypothetical protein